MFRGVNVRTRVQKLFGCCLAGYLAVFFMAPASTAATPSYSVRADFSTTRGNPNGVWTYGWMPTDFSSFALGSLWNESHWTGLLSNDPAPTVWKNTGALAYGVPTDWVSLHPGPQCQVSVIRWTAPLAGRVRITGQFLSGDSGAMQVMVRNGTRELWGARDGGSFDLQNIPVAAGEVIDFGVSCVGNFSFGNTPIDATIAYYPSDIDAAPAKGRGTLRIHTIDGQFIDVAITQDRVRKIEFVEVDQAKATGSVYVDAKSNIFVAGLTSSPGDGLKPVMIQLPPGDNRTLEFTRVVGETDCGLGIKAGPDGGACAVRTDVDGLAESGVGGVTHPSKTMFLVGTFLDDSSPSGPPPAKTDAAAAERRMMPAPSLRTTFFIGDGLSGTGDGERQSFTVPRGATRLFLGFADAWDGSSMTGKPWAYFDNSGGLSVDYRLTGAAPPLAGLPPVTPPESPPLSPPPSNPLPPVDESCHQGLYVVDGTSSAFSQNNLMVHFYRWAEPPKPGCRLIKRYFAGIGLVLADGVDGLYQDIVRDICNDSAGTSAELAAATGNPWRVNSIGLLGFSRGAIVALNVANKLRSEGCPGGRPLRAKLQLLGLVDAVRTSMPAWQGDLQIRVPHALHVTKTQGSMNPVNIALWTHPIGDIKTMVAPTDDHGTLNCARDSAGSNFAEDEITKLATRAGFGFPLERSKRRFFGQCGKPDNEAWQKPAVQRYRREVMDF